MGPPVDATTLVSRLAGMMGSRATLARGVLEQHGRSEAYHDSLPPDVVVFPETTTEVVEIVRQCASLNMPIVPFGAGTSLEGNAAAVAGGVSIDFSRMDKVLAVHASDMDVVVQPGITRKALNRSSAIPACSFRSILARTLRSAAWHRPALLARWRCATAP